MSVNADFKGMSDFFQLINIEMSDDPLKYEYPCRPIKIYVPEYATVIGRYFGKLSLANVKVFRSASLDLINEQINKVILDFSQTELSRSAFGALVEYAAMIYGTNKRLYLYRPSEQVQAKLILLKLQSFFRVIHTEDDLIMSFIV